MQALLSYLSFWIFMYLHVVLCIFPLFLFSFCIFFIFWQKVIQVIVFIQFFANFRPKMCLCSSSESKFISTIFANDFGVLSMSSLFSFVSEGAQTFRIVLRHFYRILSRGGSFPLLRHKNCGCCREVVFLHLLFCSNDWNFHPKITYH